MTVELPDGRVLLDDVSFRVGDGAKLALVGANGAGKTTLLGMVLGLHRPNEGRLEVLGLDRSIAGQRHGQRHHVLQLAHVARPTMSEKRGAHGARERRRPLGSIRWIIAQSPQEVLGEPYDVVAPVA